MGAYCAERGIYVYMYTVMYNILGPTQAAASGFNIPEDYQTHSSFNTMEKQHVVTPSAGTHGSREDLVPSGEEGAGFQYVGEEAAQYTTYPSSHTNTTV